jgi:hypothetical protein
MTSRVCNFDSVAHLEKSAWLGREAVPNKASSKVHVAKPRKSTVNDFDATRSGTRSPFWALHEIAATIILFCPVSSRRGGCRAKNLV